MSRNAESSYTFGDRVTDAIADWLHKGFAAGPLDEEEVPAGAKVNSIMCREKPNGSVRIILNMSAPEGFSVNDGIDPRDFPTVMSSTEKWLDVLDRVGRGCSICKIDWADAYKHIAVRKEDLPLLYFEWLGKFFVELCLIIGSASSPGIYDRLAKTVLDLCLQASGFPADWVIQHLDDICAAAPKGSAWLGEFDKAYKQLANELGVRLAPRDSPDKAFGLCTSGTVLGVHYDTVSWTWGIPQEKLAKLAKLVKALLGASVARQDTIQSIVGRIVHMKPLVPDGRFHMDHLNSLLAVGTKGCEKVELTAGFKRQLHFWLTMLVACSGRCSIPDPPSKLPPWALECFTDAAGGSLEGPGRGVGGVIPEWGWWIWMPWTRELNSEKRMHDGKKVSRKMSALELIGPLLVISCAADRLRGLPIRFWVDNAGACNIWKHGYSSTCGLATTIVKAISAVAAALGCQVDMEKVGRCSSPATEMADALSKGDFNRLRRTQGGQGFGMEPASDPCALLRWAAKPAPDDDLGNKILVELAGSMPVLVNNC